MSIDIAYNALVNARQQIVMPDADKREIEAAVYQKAIENLSALDDQLQSARLWILWRMEEQQLYNVLGFGTLNDWAVNFQDVNKKHIQSLCNAVVRVLPYLLREEFTHEGQRVIPSMLVEKARVRDLKDLSYTFEKAVSHEDRQQLITAMLERWDDPELLRLRDEVQERAGLTSGNTKFQALVEHRPDVNVYIIQVPIDQDAAFMRSLGRKLDLHLALPEDVA